jgi:uncharacterized protein YprB with RNaseH-like and TPR domain
MNWDDYLAGGFSAGTATKTAIRHLEASRRALAFEEHQYFVKRLKLRNAWRAFPNFRHSCAYLDIETTGAPGGGGITVIGIWDGREFLPLVQGEDLGNFPDLISRYSMIVTFCGTGFDLPALQKQFGIRFDQIHVDLHPVLRELGYRGGLKKVEKELGIERDPEVDGLNGYDAVKLWRRYVTRRDDRAMETLLAYNRADCVNMERLAEIAYERMWDRTFSRSGSIL